MHRSRPKSQRRWFWRVMCRYLFRICKQKYKTQCEKQTSNVQFDPISTDAQSYTKVSVTAASILANVTTKQVAMHVKSTQRLVSLREEILYSNKRTAQRTANFTDWARSCTSLCRCLAWSSSWTCTPLSACRAHPSTLSSEIGKWLARHDLRDHDRWT